MNVIINYFSLFVVEKPWSALQKVRPGKEKEADALKEKKSSDRTDFYTEM